MGSCVFICNSHRCVCVCACAQAPTLTLEGGRLKRSLQLVPGRDFETVPEPVWRALYHWYGANLSLPRPVSQHATHTLQLMKLSAGAREQSAAVENEQLFKKPLHRIPQGKPQRSYQ